MSTQLSTPRTRKQRELAAREAQILDVSRRLVIEHGYHGLTMDQVARELEYSKGTIYNHFSCKEEILIALAIETMEKRTGLFERAAAFQANARERMFAVGHAVELFFRLFPDHFSVEQIIRSASVWEKTSAERRSTLRGCELRCMSIVAGIVRDAIAHRQLDLPANIGAEDLVFGLWSLTSGAFALIGGSNALDEVGVGDPFEILRQNQHRLLDGYGWQPLYADLEEEEVNKRIQQEVFPAEFERLASN